MGIGSLKIEVQVPGPRVQGPGSSVQSPVIRRGRKRAEREVERARKPFAAGVFGVRTRESGSGHWTLDTGLVRLQLDGVVVEPFEAVDFLVDAVRGGDPFPAGGSHALAQLRIDG